MKNKYVTNATEESEYDRMINSLDLYGIEGDMRSVMLGVYNHETWDWTTSDGCSCSTEINFPRGYRYPVCVMHDCYWCTGRRKEGDKLFLKFMIAYRVNPVRAYTRYVAVKIAFNLWFRWRGKGSYPDKKN
jgi:hypothetical protein